jgi:hypothetical protein
VLESNTASSSLDSRHDELRRRRPPWREISPLGEKDRSFYLPLVLKPE